MQGWQLKKEKPLLALRIVRKIYTNTTKGKTAKFFEMTQQAVKIASIVFWRCSCSQRHFTLIEPSVHILPLNKLLIRINSLIHSFIHSFHRFVQNETIPCRSQKLYYFLPTFSTNYSSIHSHLMLPSISWSTSQFCCSQIHIQNPFGNSISFHSLYMPKPTQSI